LKPIRTVLLLAGTAALSIGVPGTSAGYRSSGSVPPAMAAAAAAPVTVSPLPGTLDASAQTQISFLGEPAADLHRISVLGSHTGAHSGRLEAYSTGEGASFLPTRRFAAGERVSVRAQVVVAGATRTISTQFRVAHQVHVPGGAAAVSANVGPAQAVESFRSRPDLKPPHVSVTTESPAAAPGDVFITPASGPSQSGPMIFDNSGQVVWFKPLTDGTIATNFRVQPYAGQPALSWWQGRVLSLGFGQGEDVIYDSSYRQIATVRAGNGYRADLHEFQITPRGTALITIFDPARASLASVHGRRDGAVLDGVIQEIDIKTGLVMFEWHSLHHVALAESYAQPRSDRPLDYFHINSIEQAPDGSLLVSSRNTWATYDISHTTGAVLWRLGGRHSSFAMGPGTRTAYQHDARLQADGTITLFDDEASPKVQAQSRGVRISLDYQHKTATLVRSYEHSPPLLTGSQGNLQTLANGDAFIGWGGLPYFSEYDSQGAVVFDAHISAPADSYRAYRFPWIGTPTDAPAVAAVTAGKGAATVFASWNGATEVTSWQLLGGASPSSLGVLGVVPRAGFETSIPVGSSPAYVAVRALDASGAVLGTSVAVKP
jgi:hypothetical protein